MSQEGVPPAEKDVSEKKPDYRTIEDIVIEVHADGSKTHKVLECNGSSHRRCVDQIWYDDKGKIVFAEQLWRSELGACDGTHS